MVSGVTAMQFQRGPQTRKIRPQGYMVLATSKQQITGTQQPITMVAVKEIKSNSLIIWTVLSSCHFTNKELPLTSV